MKGNFDTLIQDSRPVIVDFHAEWCGPCKMQSPILKDVALEMGEKIKVMKIDVDQNPEVAERYDIRSVPTLMIFKDGRSTYRQSGVHSKAQLLEAIMNNLK